MIALTSLIGAVQTLQIERTQTKTDGQHVIKHVLKALMPGNIIFYLEILSSIPQYPGPPR